MCNEPQKQAYYYQWGEDYFFLAGRYETALHVAKPYLKQVSLQKSGAIRVLDAGSGPGNLISKIQHFGSVFSTDCSKEALEFCRAKHGNLVFMSSLNQFSVRDESFDFAFALEVFEHIEKDKEAFEELGRALKRGGYALLTVPAFPLLWSRHDEWFGHFRRYRKGELEQKMKKAGFNILRCCYYNGHLFLPMLVLRYFKKCFGLYEGQKQDDFYKVPKWLNVLLKFLIACEVKSGLYSKLPFGTNLICLAQKT